MCEKTPWPFVKKFVHFCAHQPKMKCPQKMSQAPNIYMKIFICKSQNGHFERSVFNLCSKRLHQSIKGHCVLKNQKMSSTCIVCYPFCWFCLFATTISFVCIMGLCTY